MVDLTQCPSESLVSNTSEAVSYTKNTNLADSRGPQELPAESGLVSFTSTADKMRNLLKSKAEEWSAVMKRKKTLQLLDLPLDILKDIVKEVCLYVYCWEADGLRLFLGNAYKRPYFAGLNAFCFS